MACRLAVRLGGCKSVVVVANRLPGMVICESSKSGVSGCLSDHSTASLVFSLGGTGCGSVPRLCSSACAARLAGCDSRRVGVRLASFCVLVWPRGSVAAPPCSGAANAR